MRTKPFNTRSARQARQDWVILLADMKAFEARMDRAYGRLERTHGEEYIRFAIDSAELRQLYEGFEAVRDYSKTFLTAASPRVAGAVDRAIENTVAEEAAKAKPAGAAGS